MRVVLLLLIIVGCASAGWTQADEQMRPQPEYRTEIYFGGGSYLVSAEQLAELRGFVTSIPKLEEYEVELRGHTDNIGSREYNHWLATQRNEMVRQHLLKIGVHEAAFYKIDFGESAPIYDNTDWRGQRLNRRVDIIFKRVKM